MIYADLVTGEGAWAEVCWIVAIVLFVLAAWVSWRATPPAPPAGVLVALGLAFATLGWFLL